MWHTGLDEAQIGIKISGRNVHNLRYTDDTTLIEENEEELRSLLTKLKEGEKGGFKLNLQKTKIMAPVRSVASQLAGETLFPHWETLSFGLPKSL